MRYVITPMRRHGCGGRPCPVPLSPQALAQLYARYLELKKARRLPGAMTFEQYFWVWRSGRRGENFVGLDDGAARAERGQAADRQAGQEAEGRHPHRRAAGRFP